MAERDIGMIQGSDRSTATRHSLRLHVQVEKANLRVTRARKVLCLRTMITMIQSRAYSLYEAIYSADRDSS